MRGSWAPWTRSCRSCSQLRGSTPDSWRTSHSTRNSSKNCRWTWTRWRRLRWRKQDLWSLALPPPAYMLISALCVFSLTLGGANAPDEGAAGPKQSCREQEEPGDRLSEERPAQSRGDRRAVISCTFNINTFKYFQMAQISSVGIKSPFFFVKPLVPTEADGSPEETTRNDAPQEDWRGEL